MLVRDAMSPQVVEVGPGHTLRQAAKLMSDRNVGAAVVVDPEGAGPGIITERDVMRAIARGEDPGEVLVEDHVTTDVVYAEPSWSLDDASVAMVRGGFRHLVVLQGSELAGIISVRDIARSWAGQRGLLDEQGSGGGGAADVESEVIGTA